MQQIDIDAYESALGDLSSTMACCENFDAINTKKNDVQAKRDTLFSQKNDDELKGLLKHTIDDDTFNKVVSYGKLIQAYTDYDRKIQEAATDEEKELIINEKINKRKDVMNQIRGDSFSSYLATIIKFCLDNN